MSIIGGGSDSGKEDLLELGVGVWLGVIFGGSTGGLVGGVSIIGGGSDLGKEDLLLELGVGVWLGVIFGGSTGVGIIGGAVEEARMVGVLSIIGALGCVLHPCRISGRGNSRATGKKIIPDGH